MGEGQIVKKKRERKKKNVNLNKRLEKLLP